MAAACRVVFAKINPFSCLLVNVSCESRITVCPQWRYVLLCRAMAGHSKWENIKWKKKAKDEKKSIRFGKIVREVITCVRLYGSDPKLNSQLEDLIKRAKAMNVPKDKIESAIKCGMGTKGGSDDKICLEVRGPGASGLLLDCLTRSRQATRSDIANIIKKSGISSTLENVGAVSHMFQHKGVITIQDFLISDDQDLAQYPNEEVVSQAEELAITVGAENVLFSETPDEKKVIQLICEIKDMKNVENALLSTHPVMILSSSCEFVACELSELSDKNLELLDRLLAKFEDHPDVMKIYDNISNYPSSTCKL